MRTQAQSSWQLPKVTELVMARLDPRLWLYHLTLRLRVWPWSYTWGEGCHILFRVPTEESPFTIKEFQLISDLFHPTQGQPEGAWDDEMTWKRQTQAKKKNPTLPHREDNFLHSQKNTCLAAETTQCESPEARTPV